ncbi:sigma-54 interaction domain-containing protein [Glacieibacterium sp.]|uniref:sigma-54 interaction domain-containing protein n=1 Tax=Glacieibacterium sp. TaxID=2860237 RepID=UPI003B00D67A
MRHSSDGQNSLAELIGTSEPIRAIRSLVTKVADSTATVLITGPSGSGKDVIARLIHQRGSRAARPFVPVNCAALPRDLIESEIFGHEAGSFTGAVRARRGRFELADRGTLFLDEIGDMPVELQVKLLRVLETRVVERVGGMIGVSVDVRLIAATHVNLAAAIASGRFREDLFYRLNVVEIRVPPLADRRDDIALLAEHFAALVPAPQRVQFADATLALISGLAWRGNVRELRNFVDRATALYGGEVIGPETAMQLINGPEPQATMPVIETVNDAPVDLKQLLDGVEQGYIERALRSTDGGVAESARLLGLRRTTLIEKMRRLNIQRLPGF